MISEPEQLYLVLVSVHGLIRGRDLELGRDADTGGQVKYVVELANALGEQPGVARVDLFTRRIVDHSIDADYAKAHESLSHNVNIVRLDCSDTGYLPKEQLWDHLDSFADNMLDYLNQHQLKPHVIHSHYADAGYVATRLVHQLSIPLIHTAHSLGRTKRKYLLASGLKGDEIEKRYNLSRRVNAEEMTLGAADCVITSTRQEIEEQYSLYDYYQPQQMRVIPPGVDLHRFHEASGEENQTAIAKEINRFFHQVDKPLILALSRPDQKKNICSLIQAYGKSKALQGRANLLLIVGNRNDIRDLEPAAQEVLTEILMTIDQYDLYGKVAYPKHHTPEDVSVIYRLTALSKGVFINPALIEPFGLTLIESAASGLPVVATEDGGPLDIIENCKNGYLINPLDRQQIAEALLKVIDNESEWQQMAESGEAAVNRHYSWQAHAQKYLRTIMPIIEKTEPVVRMSLQRRSKLYVNRALFSDLDQSLIGDRKYIPEFSRLLKKNSRCSSFGIATGRRLDSALQLIKQYKIHFPDVLITSLGTEIYYGPNLTQDTAWTNHIDYLWRASRIREILKGVPGLAMQPKREQSRFKVSYFYDAKLAPDIGELRHMLLQAEQSVNVVISFGQFLDIVPMRASKGLAIRWYAEQWDIPLDHILVAGGSGADEDMIRGNTLAVLVANRHHEELSNLTELERVYYAQKPYASGIIEAINYYDFFSSCQVPSQV